MKNYTYDQLIEAGYTIITSVEGRPLRIDGLMQKHSLRRVANELPKLR